MGAEELGRVRSPADSLGVLFETAPWISAAERDELQRERFYVVATRPRHHGRFGSQVVFAVVCPSLWGTERRLLGLGHYPGREAFARGLSSELREWDAVGPFLLGRGETSSGHEAWRFEKAEPDSPSAPETP
jgi:hypothetical protein